MPDIVIDYEHIQDAKQVFLDGVKQFQETQQTVTQLVQVIQAGALLGHAGELLVDVMNSLVAKLGEGADSFQLVCREIDQAVGDLENADNTAKGKFKF